ncbi:MAG TPA: hypothetical protein VD866_04765 [Urbifossiella sp.]|nr:hypothetical protein [Urbifossiella sp.]
MLLTFLLVTVGLFALLWAVSTVAQAYVYQQPADRLPARAAVAALLVGGYVIFWVALDRKNPGKYDDFLAFAGYSTTTFDEFDAVRWEADPATQWKDFKKDATGKPAELVSHYKRSGGKTSSFVDEKSGKPFALTGDNKITAAIVLRPDPAAPPTRFASEFDSDRGRKTYPRESGRRRFLEEDGSRYVNHAQPGVLYVPSALTVFLAILINLGMFAVWYVAFWPVLRFGAGFAALMTLAFAIFTIFVVMPVLFKPGRGPKPVEEAVAFQSAFRVPHSELG